MIRQEDIYLKNTIVHILDSTVGMPVLSDTELEHGSDFADFIKAHIAKITSGGTLSYIDKVKKNNKAYTYKVQAYNTSGKMQGTGDF